MDQPGEPARLALHPRQKALDGLRVVPRIQCRFREQGECTDGRLDLMTDIGHEVPADGLNPLGLGEVVDDQADVTVLHRLGEGADGELAARKTTAIQG